MAKTLVTVCDVCKQVGKATRSYTISRDSTKAHVDLCADDGEELELIIERALVDKPAPVKRTPRATTPSGSGKGRLKVTSLAEIEKLKQDKK